MRPKILFLDSTETEHNIQWAAGFFEGEGNIRLGASKHANGKMYGTLRLTLAQVYREPLDTFKKIFGVGSVTGPYGPYNTTRQPHYQFAVSGETAKLVGLAMRPFLLIKGLQVDTAIEQYERFVNDKT